MPAQELQYSGVHALPNEHAAHQVSLTWRNSHILIRSSCSILTCAQWPVGSNGTIDVEYSLGGVPVVLIPMSDLTGSGLCGYSTLTTSSHYASGEQASHHPLFSSQELLLSFVLANSLFIMYLW